MITVVICTYNRKQYLKKSIGSILNQTISLDLIELIVIDNNSTDGTGEFVENLIKDIDIQCKYILETNQGLSYCRNRGITESKHDYIAYLDDDGVAERRWLELMLSVISENNEMYACATGDVIPIWEIPRPGWLIPLHDIYYSVFKLSNDRFIFTAKDTHTPPGGNVVYNKEVLIRFGGFNTKLGRRNKNLLSGEETLLHKEMIKNEYKLIYVPDIRIKHHIHKTRISRKWLLRRYFWGGYSINIINSMEKEQSISSIIINTLYHVYKIFFNILLLPLGFLFKPRFYYMIYLSRISKSLGTIYSLMTR